MTLSLAGLSKRYGRRVVVNHVDLDVHPGEVVGLLGPNGAGKTTTFHAIVGLIRPDGGTIRLGDTNLTALPTYQRARRGIGYLSQESSVFRRLTVSQNVDAILEQMSIPRGEIAGRRNKLLDDLGLSTLSGSYADALSGGETRRLEIARALSREPRFLLLDEPFSGIDPKAVEDIQNMVIDLRNRGIGILITDHNVRETLSITDRSYILSEGAILASGTAREIAEDDTVRAVYLGDRFKLDP
ncbi:MAG: LPS export ABC transporter ATP-binding protein [Gemmatimonadetes bacterium]|nr:LPS export ABC transporter ATP-binding protein [Gemmatimonadota bacterium]